jgi:hypothetical protein
MPDGADDTVPVPVPVRLTVKRNVLRVKVAVTEAAAFTVTVQVPLVLLHAPVQPENSEPASGAAVRTTTVPAL